MSTDLLSESRGCGQSGIKHGVAEAGAERNSLEEMLQAVATVCFYLLMPGESRARSIYCTVLGATPQALLTTIHDCFSIVVRTPVNLVYCPTKNLTDMIASNSYQVTYRIAEERSVRYSVGEAPPCMLHVQSRAAVPFLLGLRSRRGARCF